MLELILLYIVPLHMTNFHWVKKKEQDIVKGHCFKEKIMSTLTKY